MTLAVRVALNPNITNQPISQKLCLARFSPFFTMFCTPLKTNFNSLVVTFIFVVCKHSQFKLVENLLFRQMLNFLCSVSPDVVHNNLGLTLVSSSLTAAQGFGCETIFTFILVMSIYGCTDGNRPMFGSPAVGIGFTIAVVHLAGVNTFFLS